MSNSIFDLKDNVVLVTGATGYLGKAICFGLVSLGAKVLVNSRSEKKAKLIVNEIVAKGGCAEVATFDVRKVESIDRYFETYQGQLTTIVNNAYAGVGGTIETAQEAQYKDAYEIVVVAAHNIFKAALPKLRDSIKKNKPASVVNIASMYGVVSPELNLYDTPDKTNPPFYGAAKAAFIQWTKYGACEFGKEGIRFNSISPGPFPDLEKNPPNFIEKLSKKVPLQRVGTSDEIIGPVAFLASTASSYVNGANISVDGGWTAW